MALINCPECNHEISDKVKACPHCGYPFETQDEEQVQKVEISSVNIKPPKISKKIKIGILIACGVIILGVAAIFLIGYLDNSKAYTSAQDLYDNADFKGAEAAFLSLGDFKDSEDRATLSHNKLTNTYIDQLNIIRFSMLDGANKAEILCNLTARVWYNAIYKESNKETNKYTIPDSFYSPSKDYYESYYFVSDFNDALNKLFTDKDTIETIDYLELNQNDVAALLKKLQDYPDGFDKCYGTLNDLFVAYKSITDLAISPTGNYNSFSENKQNRVDEFLKLFTKLETQIPERVEVEPPVIGDLDYARNLRWGMTKDEVIAAETKIESQEVSSKDENKLFLLTKDNYGLEKYDCMTEYKFESNGLVSVTIIGADTSINKMCVMMLLNEYRDRFGEYTETDFGWEWRTEHSRIEIEFLLDGLVTIIYTDITVEDAA